ncbi:hypothetical protein GYMLUDRAFT_240818 [Collybiopsis luxurians FD-317 M1]|nr:hypothetical protein GYMLUDRAFT_240818 [Collybiopsis luxurians FD-317 M1]
MNWPKGTQIPGFLVKDCVNYWKSQLKDLTKQANAMPLYEDDSMDKEDNLSVTSILLNEDQLVHFVAWMDEQKALPVLQMGDIPIVLQEPEGLDNKDGLPIYSEDGEGDEHTEGGQGNNNNDDDNEEEEEEAEGVGKGLNNDSAEEEEANDSTQINTSKSKLAQDKNPTSSKTCERTNSMPK